jgi:hypothetical protein
MVQVAYCSKRDQQANNTDSYLKGLGMAIDDCPGLTQSTKSRLTALKDTGRKMFAPEHGGSYEVWRTRPMDATLLDYAAADVRYLHTMRDAWRGFVCGDMYSITAGRVQKAIHGRTAARGPHMAMKDFDTGVVVASPAYSPRVNTPRDSLYDYDSNDDEDLFEAALRDYMDGVYDSNDDEDLFEAALRDYMDGVYDSNDDEDLDSNDDEAALRDYMDGV